MTRAPQPLKMLGFWLVVCALALRLGVPAGFMPTVNATGVTITMCSGQGPMRQQIPGKPDPAMPGHGGCAFASLAVATAPDVPVIAASPVVQRPITEPMAPRLRTPYVGVPAPPPPAIGPPTLI